MTATAEKESSQYWEAAFDLPLSRARKLAKEPRNLFDDAERVMDRTVVDRMLIDALSTLGLGGGPKSPNWEELADVLLDVGERLRAALDEIRELVKQDHLRENARGIVQQARAEGRIPPEDA
jgi:hypothetical protein